MSLSEYFLWYQNWSLAGAVFLLLTFGVYLLWQKPTNTQRVSMFTALSLIYLVCGSPLEGLLNFGLHSVAMLQQVIILMVVPLFIWNGMPKDTFPKIALFPKRKLNILLAWISGTLTMWAAHFISAAKISAETGLSICGIKASTSSIFANIPNLALVTGLLLAGIFFLNPVFSKNPHYKLAPLKAVGYLFTACLSCSLLGLWVAFSASGSPILEASGFLTTLRNPLPLTLREDQELAGMIMWVPGCVLYVSTSVHIAIKWMDGGVKPALTANTFHSEK